MSPRVKLFLKDNLDVIKYINSENIDERKVLLDNFSLLEDNDIMVSAKVWAEHNDRTLAILSRNLVTRKLFKIELQYESFPSAIIQAHSASVSSSLGIAMEDIGYFVFSGEISINTYKTNDDWIKILLKSGDIVDITEASDMLDKTILAKAVVKHFLCYPKSE